MSSTANRLEKSDIADVPPGENVATIARLLKEWAVRSCLDRIINVATDRSYNGAQDFKQDERWSQAGRYPFPQSARIFIKIGENAAGFHSSIFPRSIGSLLRESTGRFESNAIGSLLKTTCPSIVDVANSIEA